MLVEVLAEVVAHSPGAPTAGECIVVQGRGMERWLSMELARRLGVWANPDFPFPRHLIERVLDAVLGPAEEQARVYEPAALMWSIADLLPRHLGRPGFEPIGGYLAGDEDETKRVELAERIARTFDDYAVYRPRMVLEWAGGVDAHWQAVLWRALVSRHGPAHIAARAQVFLEVLGEGTPDLSGLPRRLSVFGISTLAPLYLEILAALARFVELHLFVLSPSREYWAEIRAQRELVRGLGRESSAAEIEALVERIEGNPLLASLGRLGRDFQQVLEAAADYQEDDADLYREPGGDTMLAVLQSDMLWLRHRGVRKEQVERLPLAEGDCSIGVHACHGPMREVEVLHDQLLALFDRDRTLEPRDVVVMTPAIETYAPFVEAVFGARADDLRVPYRIADRNRRATSEVVDAFLDLLRVLASRMTATDVLDLLRSEVIRSRFGIGAEDLDLLHTWVRESGIRWGVDRRHRESAGQPPLAENTWRFGLERLLVGYAMPAAGRGLYRGVLPYDDIEGAAAQLLGRFADFLDTLFRFRDALQAPRPLPEWSDELSALLAGLVATTDQTAYQHRWVRAALAELAARAAGAGFAEPVALHTVGGQLAGALQRGTSVHGFLSGGVAFCELVPMRAIPFRVVCLIGMNDGAFPRTRRPLGFDLIAQHPRAGDRSARNDDRYLFLEALLSARERLIITYVGQSINDNTEIPPSVVVNELLDVLEDSFATRPSKLPGAETEGAGGDIGRSSVRDRVVVRHPLQPFSRSYFRAGGDQRLFSYSRGSCDGARALAQPRRRPRSFLCAPLAPEDEGESPIEVDDLARFFDNPSRMFLQRRLGLYLGGDALPLADREPLQLDSLERWKLGDQLLGRALRVGDLGDALPSLRAGGGLPLGVLGRCVFEDLWPGVERVAERAAAAMSGARLAPLEIDCRIERAWITGFLRDVWADGQVGVQYARVGGRHELALWIRHVLLNLIASAGYPRASVLVGQARDGGGGPASVHFLPIGDAQSVVRELLRLYEVGQRFPLPLFERSSRKYVEELLESGGDEALALRRAQEVFRPGWKETWGDANDDYVRQIYGDGDPLARGYCQSSAAPGWVPGFREAALAVYRPLLEHRRETV